MITLVAVAGALSLVLVYDGLTSKGKSCASRSAFAKLDGAAREAGLRRVGVRGLVVASAGLWLGTLIVVAGMTSSFVVALALSIGAACAPISYVRSRRRSRLRRLREGWPEAIATLISGVRAGSSLPEACAALSKRSPEGLKRGFLAMEATYRASGSFEASLSRLRTELADPVADRVAAALEIAHGVGGTELVRVLRTLGDFVREDLRVRKEIEARWSWTVTAARVAAAAPWLVLLMMATRPEAAAAYNSSTGIAVIGGGAAATLVGYRLMLRAARLPEERRLTR